MAKRRHTHYNTSSSGELEPIVRLWLLRLLVPLGAHREFIHLHGFSCDTLAVTLGFGKWIDSEDIEFEQQAVRMELRKLYQTEEKKLRGVNAPDCLRQNVARLSDHIGLSRADRQILEFAVLIHCERLLDDTADWLGNLSSVKVIHVLSVILELPEPDIRSSLGGQGILARSGLVSVDRNCDTTLRGKLDLLSCNFADYMSSTEADPITLLRDTVLPSSPPELAMSDFLHMAPNLAILRPYLARSIECGRKGVNIFLHGDPGTGKNQLSKVLAAELGCELFEVASEDSDGDPVDGGVRLRSFRAAQSLMANRRALLLFDEVEDVFNDGNQFWGHKSTAQTSKAWINRILEGNRVPTLWLSNSIDCLDPAFTRRFDMVIELPVPPKKQRERIIQKACGDLLDTKAVARLAECETLAPAVVTRAASVVCSIRDELDEIGAAQAVELLISNTLQAQGHHQVQKHDPNRLPEVYDPAFLNTDIDLAKIAIGLTRSRSGRLCLYGPPGTGKTAYGRWLADQLGVPLVLKRASDLLSMWVGGTEKNIAHAFRQAEEEGALLLIDEIDSFLQDRRNANHGWEVTAVNEMLTQMESFPGVFIASTNLMQGLDQASLRRFDLKVKFDFLKTAQARELLDRYCAKLEIGPPETEAISRLLRLTLLAPGDYAAVMRQNRFHPLATPVAFVAALEAECQVKEGSKGFIGFIPS